MKNDPPRYLKKLLEATRQAQLLPGVHVVNVYHDDGCDLLAGRGPCNCDPDVRVELPGKN